MRTIVLFAALAIPCGLAAAQPVYRCGNSYSQTPCPDGTIIATADPRTPADAARTEAATRADARRAQDMEKARLAQEARAPQAVVLTPATATDAAPGKKNAAPVKLAKGSKLEQFTAVSPRPPKAPRDTRKGKNDTQPSAK